MFKKSNLAIVCCAVLAGCGGSGSSSNTSSPETPTNTIPADKALDSQFYGLWSLDQLAYVAISKDSTTLFTFDPYRECYEATLYKVDSSTVTSQTTTDLETGEQETSHFALEGNQLKVEENGQTALFSKATRFSPTPSCVNNIDISSVSIKIDLTYLPPGIMINRDAMQESYSEYSYEVNFDINKNNLLDPGDLNIRLSTSKTNGRFPNNYTVALSDLDGRIWTLLPQHQADYPVMTTSYTTDTEVQVSQEQNSLLLTFATEQHPLLAHLSPDTPVFIRAHINYPEPESDVIDGWQDGPWKWSSDKHRDELPDEGYARPSDHVDFKLTDASSDQEAGESQWVDITSVQFTYSK